MPEKDESHFNKHAPNALNETDWVDYIVAYIVALQRFFRIPLLHLQADRKETIEKRSTLFLPLAGTSLALLLTLLLAVLQFFWPLGIAVLLLGSLELLFLRTFVPEAIPQCRELLAPQKSSISSGNIFVLTIIFMLLRMGLIYQLIVDFSSMLTACILILTSISLGTWIIPFSISFTISHDESARWVNPNLPLSKKQLIYGSSFLIGLLLLGTWASLNRLFPALVVSGLLLYWIMRKLGDHDKEVTDTHLEGLASLFQIVFLLVCTIDYSFLNKLSA